MNVVVTAASPDLLAAARCIAARYGLPCTTVQAAPAQGFELHLDETGLALRACGPGAPGPVRVDWVGGTLGHRRRYGGGRGQPLARAVGLKSGLTPLVLDATAGLGRDACVLLTLGCRLHLVERSPVIAALLEDGLRRAAQDAVLGSQVREQVRFTHADGVDALHTLAPDTVPEVVYLDPMYPHRDKSALVKKEMRLFRALVGDDLDAGELLAAALAAARRRVVVKRPRLAPALPGPAPSFTIDSPNTRYDVYVIAAL